MIDATSEISRHSHLNCMGIRRAEPPSSGASFNMSKIPKNERNTGIFSPRLRIIFVDLS